MIRWNRKQVFGRMKLALLIGVVCLALANGAPAKDQASLKTWVTGLKNPESVAVGPDGRIYASVIGEFGKDGDGSVVVVAEGKAEPYVDGLDDPKGMIAFKDWLFVTDKNRVWRIDRTGKKEVFAAADAFPQPPIFLNDITVDEQGTLYVSDTGDQEKGGAAVYSINPQGKVKLITDAKKAPAIKMPNGLLSDGLHHLLLLDFGTGELQSVKVADGSATKVAEGLGGGDGLARDNAGRVYTSDWKSGKVYVIPRPGDRPVVMNTGLKSAADLCLDPTGKSIVVPDMMGGAIASFGVGVPDQPVDESPLAVKTELAFPKLNWTGWQAVADSGEVVPLRPIVLTHAGDGSNRVFVATQQGVIHVFPNDQNVEKTQVYFDMQKKVVYNDKQNEEGFLGFAFHPKYKSNGEFFVYYTTTDAPHTSVVSRFRVSPDDPNKADPAFEEEILRIPQPFWNHNGGTVAFGPDGYLYIGLGDGGLANDPMGNGQNLKTLLGSVLRIDVDRKEGGKNYAIPKDNPFVGRADARPEIWCYGVRNIWRLAFDKSTGLCWAGDVGQNLFEEIDLLVSGGNYGWNLREAFHPFSANGVGPREDLIDPIWEYPHEVGKSITGGLVYHGKRVPELGGAYLYADYVSNKHWALWYDVEKKRVVANREIANPGVPVLSFGEDEQGEVYFMTFAASGKGIYRYVSASTAAAR
ncbi:MAG: PQQ-dependent sugar dehydrogenase [Planctomycetota bacterium]